MKDITKEIQLETAGIYIKVRQGKLTIEVDGGDGINRLSDRQIKMLRDILNSVEIKKS
jgi:hypothetical protein